MLLVFVMISRFVSVFLCLCWAMYSTKTQLCSGMRLPFKKRLTIPNPVRSNVPNTWAYDTMSRRIHENILPRIIEDNSEELTYPSSPLRSECLLLLNDLKASLECGKSGVLRGIVDSGTVVTPV